MNISKNIRLSILIGYLVITATIPTQAIQPQKQNNQYIALSWGDIWKSLQRRKTPKGGRGEICAIIPQGLISSDNQKENPEIWNDRPLFLWRQTAAKPIKIEIFEKGKAELFETIVIKQGQTNLVYNGKPLQPGQLYTWQLSADIDGRTIKDGGSDFQLMEPQRRLSITKSLTELEARLKQQGASAEKITLEKANYFAQQGIWADTIQQLYSVPKPSKELAKTISDIEAHNFCGTGQAPVSIFPHATLSFFA